MSTTETEADESMNNRPSAQGNTHPTPVYQTMWLQPLYRDNHDYIIILLYLDCITSSGQMEYSKIIYSLSFCPNKNWLGQFDQTTKRSILNEKNKKSWEI